MGYSVSIDFFTTLLNRQGVDRRFVRLIKSKHKDERGVLKENIEIAFEEVLDVLQLCYVVPKLLLRLGISL